jgi:hypothetical protein
VNLLCLHLLQLHLHLFFHDVALRYLRLPLLLLAIAARLQTELLFVSLSSSFLCILVRLFFLSTTSNFNYFLGFLLSLPDFFSSLLFFQAKQADAICQEDRILLCTPSSSVRMEQRTTHVGWLRQA